MEKIVIIFNDFLEVVIQFWDEVMGLKSLFREQCSVNNVKVVDIYVFMLVKEVVEYLGIFKGMFYMKLLEGSIFVIKFGKCYCFYWDELDRCWNFFGRILYFCLMRNLVNLYFFFIVISLIFVIGKNLWKRIRIILI